MKPIFLFLGLMINLNSLFAASAGPAPTTYMTSLREAVGFAIGYGNHTFYAQSNCPSQDPAPASGEDCDDAPPFNGLVGVSVDIVNQLQTMLNSAGVADCSSIPSSGTGSATSSGGTAITLTYGTPTHSVPSGWDGGGSAYTKRVGMDFVVASLTTKVFVEFACGGSSVYMGVNMLVGNHAPGYERRINIITGVESGEKITEIYIAEYHPTNETTRGAYAIRAKINESNSTYRIWSTTSGQNNSLSTMVRGAISGNYSTNQASVFLKTFNVYSGGSYYDPSAISSLTGGSSAAVESSSEYNFQQDWSSAPYTTVGNIYTYQGCVDFDDPTAALSSANLCSGFTLEDPAAPALSSSGAFSALWPIQSMPALIDVSGLAVQ